jgi:hypothetical protein
MTRKIWEQLCLLCLTLQVLGQLSYKMPVPWYVSVKWETVRRCHEKSLGTSEQGFSCLYQHIMKYPWKESYTDISQNLALALHSRINIWSFPLQKHLKSTCICINLTNHVCCHQNPIPRKLVHIQIHTASSEHQDDVLSSMLSESISDTITHLILNTHISYYIY